MSSEIIASRAVSAFAVSIGTSLSLESISNSGGTPYDPERQIPQHVNIRDYKEFWINIGTLFRNLHGAIPRTDIERVRARDCADALLQEMSIIESVIRSDSYSLTKTVFYICNYSRLGIQYPHANIRGVQTEKQLAYNALYKKTVQFIIDMFHSETSEIKIFDSELQPTSKIDALILTHAPHDLLSEKKFKSLDLLESHTGVLKSKNLWYTKYYNGKDLPMLPFNRTLLQVFGDNDLFHPMNITLRREIIELSKQKKWTFATTHDKVKADIKTLKNPYAAFIVKTLA